VRVDQFKKKLWHGSKAVPWTPQGAPLQTPAAPLPLQNLWDRYWTQRTNGQTDKETIGQMDGV